jgi:hypothetical protein
MNANTRNQYVGTEIKWIVAIKTNGGDWEIKYLGSGERPALLSDDGYIHPIIDNCPAYIRDNSEFAVFRNRKNWWEKKPYLLSDWRDKKDWLICADFGFINELGSDWF